VSAQVAYDKISTQWHFPSLWYTIQREFKALDGQLRTVDFIVIDTVVLCGAGPSNEIIIDGELEFVGGKADAGKPGSLRARVAKQHWEWLERELGKSSANFLWVAGHYPVWSSGDDGSTQCLIDRLFPLLQAHGAHYISGHDHQLSHVRHKGTNMFVVGAGKECCYNAVNAWQVPTGALQFLLAGQEGAGSVPPVGGPVYGGYASLNFQADAVFIVLRSHDGDALYKTPPIHARDVPKARLRPVPAHEDKIQRAELRSEDTAYVVSDFGAAALIRCNLLVSCFVVMAMIAVPQQQGPS